MRKVSKGMRALVSAGVMTATISAVLATAPPAFASVSGCQISGSDIACQTATLYANPGHWIRFSVYVPRRGTVTCRVHDAVNGSTVGQASRSWTNASGTGKTINGLYGRYFLVCVNSSHSGGGEIAN
ncbi:hypothetical protein [Nonomuraea sp. NPDC048826]|uniref:hypothetical protein n=1 Tax=Nonomuraea sp. NPDC048826 TaxID=3364347 RepID=UPI003716F4B5